MKVSKRVKRPILLDTNILSTFAKVDSLNLLFQVLERNKLYIVNSVFHELEDAKVAGFRFVNSIFDLITSNKIPTLSMTDEEMRWRMQLPSSFGKGERDSLAICKFRDAVFFTNERKVINYCDRESISALDLPTILRLLWKSRCVDKKEVEKLIDLIEAKDNIRFKYPSLILKD